MRLKDSITEQSTSDSVRAVPVLEAFERLGIGPTMGYELLNNANDPQQRAIGNFIESYYIGRLRYTAVSELHRFIETRIAEARGKSSEERSVNVAAATAARKANRQPAAQPIVARKAPGVLATARREIKMLRGLLIEVHNELVVDPEQTQESRTKGYDLIRRIDAAISRGNA